jgi:hypothetical protein
MGGGEMVDVRGAVRRGRGRPRKSNEMDPLDPHKGSVTDSGKGVCVDPGEKGAILETGGPARQKGEKAGSWLQTAKEKGHSNMVTGAGDGLATASRDVYAQSECFCALYSSYTV